VYSPAAGTVPKAGNDTLKVTFTPTFSKDYTTVTASVELQVNQSGANYRLGCTRGDCLRHGAQWNPTECDSQRRR